MEKLEIDSEEDSDDSADILTHQNINKWKEDTDTSEINGSGTLILRNGHKYEGELFKGRKRGIDCINIISDYSNNIKYSDTIEDTF